MTARPDRPISPRVAPLDPPYSEELKDLIEKTLMGPTGRPINIFGTLAHHPRLMKRFNLFAGFFLNSGLLPAREREIVILRVGHNCSSVYEFGQHTIIGERVGLTMKEISALADSASTHAWSEADRSLIALADDLCTDDCVSDTTWAQLRSTWSEPEMIELVLVAGVYRMVSGFLNTMGVERDEGVPSWPR